MPYNGSGVFSIINTFTPGTTISSSAVNANFTDIGTGLSDVLTRDGQAPMTAALKVINGSSSVPSLAFASDPTTGLYRASSGVVGVSGALSATSTVNGSTIQQNGSTLIPVGLGPLPWSGATAPSLWVFANGQTLSRSTYSALWTFAQTEIAGGNTFYGVGDGSTNFTVGTMIGYVPAGVDASATRLPSMAVVGATSGSATHALVVGEIPSITSTNAAQSITVNPNGSASSHVAFANANWAQTNSFATTGATTGAFTAGSVGDTTTFSANNSISVTSTGTSGTAHSIVQPSRAFNYIIFAGV